ncbi:polysaccharide deacetylase family protein [Blastococcus deserti]|uniref:Polysaccharide deacetylase family protein n=1 Tax=Blastococcus deserti TaxID=2259033 RepID=A0ABW4XHM0_9ACTN
MARELLILGYHRIGPPGPDGWETWFFVPQEVFDHHLDLIRDSVWQPIDLDAFLRGLDDPATLPEHPILLTFDDGYRCMRDVAAPVLHRHGMPAVLFVPTDHVGGPNAFDPWEPPGRICDWADLRFLERRRIAVQSHAASHRTFGDLTLQEQTEELHRSKQAIEKGLGRPVHLLAYPFGDRGREPERMAQAARSIGYSAGCGYPGGVNDLPVPDAFALQRVAMGPDTDLASWLARD